MDQVGVFEAKARLSEIIERAQAGRETVITKRGVVVARVVPAGPQSWDRADVLDEAEAFRKSVKIKGRHDIRTLIEAGRR